MKFVVSFIATLIFSFASHEVPAAPRLSALVSSDAPEPVTVGCPFETGSVATDNRNLIDSVAFYGMAQLPGTLPAGVEIRITGRFPHTRYFSLQGYDGFHNGNQVDSLPDARIVPNGGGALDPNPAALPLARNYAAGYRVVVKYASPPDDPADRAPNTLYVGPPTSDPARPTKQIMYRTYLPNPGADISGSTPVPELVYSGPAGDINFKDTPDGAQCQRISEARKLLGTGTSAPLAARDIAFAPASQNAVQFANGDASYLYATSSRRWGPLVVVRARRFAVPALPAAPQPAQVDVRYWSLCTYAPLSTANIACLADRQLVTQPDGYNVIVISDRSRRPALANAANGYNWIDSSGHYSELIVLRQLLARPGFGGAYTRASAQASAPLGQSLDQWLPEVSYCDSAAFAAYAASGGAALMEACRASASQLLPPS